ncbi:MAG: methionyl-tRNA formyltransferase [Phycisphaerae bacterium]|nr:MAG: methionyl-tRNA formyltransferase [Phycisphaerae bacterium]
MRIVLMASGDFAIPTMRSLLGRGHELPLVVTQPDRGSGRGRKPQCTATKAKALELGLEVLATPDINEPAVVDQLRELRADLGVAIAFGQKIGAEVRGLFAHDCINLHASLLPKYRGAAPFQWCVINGDQETGVTTFRLVDRMDAGPIYVQRTTELRPQERACELHDRLAAIGVDAIHATIELFESDASFEPVPQDDTLATKAPKIAKSDGNVRFDQSAKTLVNKINGLWDWPGARCQFVSKATGKSETVILALARLGADEKPAEAPGVIDFRRQVATADRFVEILEVKPSGGRLMPFEDYVNGRRIQPGDTFEPII